MIEVKNVSKIFTVPSGQHRALHKVNITIDDGDIFGIIGMSGAGKSTLVRCLNVLEKPSTGEILVDGLDITQLGAKDLRKYRQNISMIFQNFNLFSQKTVLDNVIFPLEVAGKKSGAKEKGLKLLEELGLKEKAQVYPSQLSGGQKQRVAIARALVNDPKYILCDEATSALDTLTTNQILKLLRDLAKKHNITLVIITHSMDVVEKVCNKVAVLNEGSIVECGDTHEVFSKPQQYITKQLLGQVRWDS